MKSFRKHYSNNSSRFFFNSGFKHTIQWLVFTLLTHVATTAGYRKREPFNSYSAWLHVLSDNEASLLLQHCTFSPVSLWHSNLQFIIDFALQFLHSSPTKEVNIIFAFLFFFLRPLKLPMYVHMYANIDTTLLWWQQLVVFSFVSCKFAIV